MITKREEKKKFKKVDHLYFFMKVQIKINYFPSSQLSVPSHHSSLWDDGQHGVDGEENDEHEQH